MKKWLITLFSIALSLVAFEVILRVVVPESGLDRFGSDKVENHEFSYVATYNSLGYRGAEFAEKSRPGVRRVLFIGDSFVYGAGVARAETIPSLLEDKLNSLEKSQFEVLNLGLPDGNTVQYLETAEAFAHFDADIVLLGFYVDNDAWTYERKPDQFLVWSLLNRFGSKFYFSIFRKCKYEWAYNYNIDPLFQDLACEGKINPWLLSRADRKNQGEHVVYEKMSRRLSKNPKIINNIKSIRRIFNDKEFYVVILPAKYQISDVYFDKLKKIGFIFHQNRPINNKIQLELQKLLISNDIKFIDLLPTIINSWVLYNRKHYYDIDDHFNAFGNEVVAAAIAEVLQTSLVE